MIEFEVLIVSKIGDSVPFQKTPTYFSSHILVISRPPS